MHARARRHASERKSFLRPFPVSCAGTPRHEAAVQAHMKRMRDAKEAKAQEKRDAAYAATSAKSKKEIQKEKDKKRQAKARQIKALRKKVEQCLFREQCLQECLQRGLNDMRALRRKYESCLRELTGVPELPVEDLTESPPHAPSTSTGTRPRPASNEPFPSV